MLQNEELKLYAIIRADLGMSTGKIASQAGHAFLNAYLETLNNFPQIAKEYQKEGIGTKICLNAKDLNKLLIIQDKLKAANINHCLIIDSGHICPPFFDGSPIVTALGIGPIYPLEVKSIIRRLKLI